MRRKPGPSRDGLRAILRPPTIRSCGTRGDSTLKAAIAPASPLPTSGETRHLHRMTERFILRPDRHGFTVQDVLTGQPAVIASTPQTGLSRADATHTADLLNSRVTEDERSVPQPG